MHPTDLFAGALSLVLIHEETGCTQSALNAARVLDALCDMNEIDAPTRELCERASQRLRYRENRHACPA